LAGPKPPDSQPVSQPVPQPFRYHINGVFADDIMPLARAACYFARDLPKTAPSRCLPDIFA
jgi:hypothetical protein